MLFDSLRSRLLSLIGVLLVVLLAGFGYTAYEFNRRERLQRVDEELARRVAAVVMDVRGRPPESPREPMREPPGGDSNRPSANRDREPPGGYRKEPPPGGYGKPPPSDRNGQEGSRPPPPPDGPRSRGEGSSRPPGSPNAPGVDASRITEATLAMFDESSSSAPYYAVWGAGDTPEFASKLSPPALEKPPATDSDSRTHIRESGSSREAYFFTELGHCVLVGMNLKEELASLRQFLYLLIAVGAVILVIGLGGAWTATTKAIRPVEDIGLTAGRIAAGDLSSRVPLKHATGEIGRLATVLNATFARLEAAFDQQKHFAADASHELRTPLAVLITDVQTTLTRERSPAEYRETLEGCLETAQQMRRLTESLLALARFDAGQEQLAREPMDLADVARSRADALRPLGEKRGIVLDLHLTSTPMVGDRERLGQVVTNLLGNAIYYNVEGGRVSLTTRVEGNTVQLIVTDTGVGIAAEDVPRIFERFFRADKARSRSEGRSGLGLAICRAIVEAHGGKLEVASVLGKGSVFTMTL